MITKLLATIDSFLFGETITVTEVVTRPVKVRIVKPGESLGMTTNTFSPKDDKT